MRSRHKPCLEMCAASTACMLPGAGCLCWRRSLRAPDVCLQAPGACTAGTRFAWEYVLQASHGDRVPALQASVLLGNMCCRHRTPFSIYKNKTVRGGGVGAGSGAPKVAHSIVVADEAQTGCVCVVVVAVEVVCVCLLGGWCRGLCLGCDVSTYCSIVCIQQRHRPRDEARQAPLHLD